MTFSSKQEIQEFARCSDDVAEYMWCKLQAGEMSATDIQNAVRFADRVKRKVTRNAD